MFELASVYKRYPFKIPLRVRFFNLFRIFFRISFLERMLVERLAGQSRFWRRFIPPVYFYEATASRIAERAGARFELYPARLIDHSLYFYTLRERSWDSLLKEVHRDSVVLDIGANIGALTVMLAQRCPLGHVVAFEPDSENFRCLQKNVALNQLDNVTCVNYALGETQREGTIYKLYTNNPGANRLLPRPPEFECGSELVEVRALDDVVDDLIDRKPDIIKIDVEGYELAVLQGSVRILAACRPILFLEVADANLVQQGLDSATLLNYLDALNYDIIDAESCLPLERSAKSYHKDVICYPKT